MAATKRATAPSVDMSKWLTRDQVSDILGVATRTVVQMGNRGLLHPILTTRPPSLRLVYLYDPQELDKVPRKFRAEAIDTEGEQAARAFEHMADGRSNVQIVMLLRASTHKVEALREKWLDGGGADLVVTPWAKTVLEEIFGSFQTIVELVTLARAATGKASVPAPDATHASTSNAKPDSAP